MDHDILPLRVRTRQTRADARFSDPPGRRTGCLVFGVEMTKDPTKLGVVSKV